MNNMSKKRMLAIVSAAILCFNTFAFSTQTAGWLMNEGSGTTVADTAGANDVLTFGMAAIPSSIFNPTWSIETPFNRSGFSLYFDGNYNSGSGDYAYAQDSAELSVGGSGQMSIMGWIKLDANSVSYIINKWNTNTIDRAYSLSVERFQDPCDPAKVTFRAVFYVSADGVDPNTRVVAPLTTTVPVGKWTHLAAVIRDEPMLGKRMLLYQNGLEINRGALSSFFTVHDSANQLWIGRYESNVAAAKITDVRIYDNGLSAEDIAAIARNPKDLRNAPASWTFNEGAGVTCFDSGTLGVNDTMLFGSYNVPLSIYNPTWSTDSPFGVLGSSLYFDGNFNSGSCDYLFAADSADLDLGTSGEMAIEAWFKLGAVNTFYIANKWSSDYLDRSYMLAVETGGTPVTARPKFAVSADGTTTNYNLVVADANFAVPSGQWTHLVGVLTNTSLGKRMILYKNGVEIGRSAVPDNLTIHNSGNQLWLGRLGSTAGKGYIDEVTLYNRALSAQEVTNLYKSKWPCPIADFTGDCTVDYNDLKILADNWLQNVTASNEDMVYDRIINLRDFASFAAQWLQTWHP